MPRVAVLRHATTQPSADEHDTEPSLGANTHVTSWARLVRRHFNDRTFVSLDLSPSLSRDVVTTRRTDIPNLDRDMRDVLDSTAVSPTKLIAAPTLPTDPPPLPTTYHALQEWEGHVLEIGDETFDVAIADITAGAAAPLLTTTLPLSDLTEDEKRALRSGSIFRWTIGYERTPAGQRKRVSRIIFRQLPRWTDTEIRAAKEAAASRVDEINWD